MAPCCPRGRGCNAPGGNEPCALVLCDAVAEHDEEAALALARWDDLRRIGEHDEGRERRFRRRAFERARDRALQALAMQIKPSMLRTRPEPARPTRLMHHRTKLARRAVA